MIGSYVVNGNRDANGSMIPGQDITIVTTLSDDGAQFPSLHNGFFSLEGYVTGQATISCSRLTAKRFRLSASNRLRRVLCPIRR